MRFLIDENIFHRIIHIRIHPPLLEHILPAIDNLLKKYNSPSFQGKLIVLSKNGYRIR